MSLSTRHPLHCIDELVCPVNLVGASLVHSVLLVHSMLPVTVSGVDGVEGEYSRLEVGRWITAVIKMKDV